MANYYSQMTAYESVPCTEEEFEQLLELLEYDENSDEDYHGVGAEYSSQTEDPKDYGIYIFSEESAQLEVLPEKFLKDLGALIGKAGKPYLELGVAWSCDRLRAGSHGGTSYRIYPDGQLVEGTTTFDYTPEELIDAWEKVEELKKDIWSGHPGFPRQDWQHEVARLDTQLGYWDWVWHQIEAANGS